MIAIQITPQEAHRLLALLFEHPNPANLELIQTLEAALDDATIAQDDYTFDE